jgi:PelA/Pel-15E family pectate lyase
VGIAARVPARFRTVLLSVGLLLATGGAGRAAGGPANYLDRPDAWFGSGEARKVAGNILSNQAEAGGWPKNIDTAAEPFRGSRDQIRGSFDNGATTPELRFLARFHQATGDGRARQGFEKGFDHIIQAQYPSGGWPQFYPPSRSYHRHITFNDGTMVRLLEFLRDTTRSNLCEFLDSSRKGSARTAFDRGVQCILKCQIKVGDRLTAWCAQHDAVDFSPRPGRTYEPVSISGAESVGIVRLLMSVDSAHPGVRQAVEGAVAWFEAARISGIRVVLEQDERSPTGRNKVVVKDPGAPALWARFYEIGSNKPLFLDRDGVPKDSLAQIGYERRNGYAWYGDWPQALIGQEYPAWKKRIPGQ